VAYATTFFFAATTSKITEGREYLNALFRFMTNAKPYTGSGRREMSAL
jgi:hypothetical protein